MYEKNVEKKDEVELDFGRVLSELWKGKWLIVIVSILCTLLVLVGTLLFVTPQYTCSAMFYVNNSSPTGNTPQSGISSSDITASKNLVNSYIVILKTRETLVEIMEYTEEDISLPQLRDMISAGAVDETEIFRVTVTSPDPRQAEELAHAIAKILPQRLASIIEGTSAKVVDVAGTPTSPSFPNYSTAAVLGFLLGFLLSFGGVALRAVFDVTVRTEEDVTQVCQLPVLASVPDMGAVSKGGHEYGADRKKTGAAAVTQGKQPVMGSGISFAASEAYKLLRTKLQFSFADEESNCRVIGVSSALSGEGKSLSSINLAFSLSEMNKKVLLIDCDMRRPTLASKLNLHKAPGLSSFLTGQSTLNGLVQNCGIPGSETAFHVLVAGKNPPNPIELLSSVRMEKMLQGLRGVYDYVILDLPPVGEVSDAMAVANKTDGILLVVRHNYCSRPALSDAIRQFSFIDAKLLGIVCNCATENSGKYGKGYYKKYYGNAYKRSNAEQQEQKRAKGAK